MTRVRVALGERGYEVEIEAGLLDRAGERILPLPAIPRVFVVTDANVAAAQLSRLLASLEARDIGYEVRVVPSGEASKSWAELGATTERLVAAGCGRGDVALAFGGCVIDDLARFLDEQSL